MGHRNNNEERERRNRDLVIMYQSGDESALTTLVDENWEFIEIIAKGVYGRCNAHGKPTQDIGDLIQEGWLGFLEAVKRYHPDNPEKAGFATYIGKYVWGYMRHANADRSRLIRKPRRMDTNPKTPTDDVYSLDFVSEDGCKLGDYIPSPIDVVDAVERDSLCEDVRNAVNNGILTKVEKSIITLYYYDGMTLADIATVFGISKEAVRQRKKRVEEKVRRYLTELRDIS